MWRFAHALVVLLFVAVGCGGGGGEALPLVIPPPVNVPPTVEVTAPANHIETGLGVPTDVTIVYADDDPDDVATTDLFADQDGDLETTGDQIVIDTGRPDGNGATQSVVWHVAGVPAGTYQILAQTTDGKESVLAGAPGVVFVNSPPTLNFVGLSTDIAISRGATVNIAYADDDEDDAAMTWLFADRDGQLDTTNDTIVIAAARAERNGLGQNVVWDTTGVPFGTYRIMGLTWDGTNAPATRTAVGRVVVSNASFASSAGGTGLEFGTGMAAFGDGSSIVVGTYSEDAVFGLGEANETTLAHVAADDAFVARYAPNGVLLWAHRIAGADYVQAYAVATHPNGTATVTGLFGGTVTFGEGGAGATSLTAAGAYDLFVARYNADGTLAWARRAGGTGSICYGFAIAGFPDGSLVVTGSYGGDVTFAPGEGNATTIPWNDGFDAFVARYNASGTLAWVKRATSTGDEEGYGIATFPDGTCVVTGYFTGEITFGAGESGQTTLVPFGDQEVFVARYGTTGNVQWASQAGGTSGVATGNDVTTFSDGSCAVTGWFVNGMDFGFGEANETNFFAFSESDAFVARFNTSGQLTWAVQQGSFTFDAGTGIEARPDGSCIVTGYFGNSGLFGIGDPNETLLFAISPADLYLARLAPDGSLDWVRQAGGDTAGVFPGAMTTFLDGSIGVVGQFDGGYVIFGEGDTRQWPVFSEGALDLFVARYNADGHY